MSLRLIWIAATTLVLLMLDGAVWLHIQSERNASRQVADNRSRAVASLVMAHAESVLGNADLLLNGMRYMLETEPYAMQRGNRTVAGAMDNQRQSLPATLAIFVFDRLGNLVNYSGPPPPLTINVQDRAYFQYHRTHATKSMLVEAPLRNRSTGEWILPLSYRLNDARGDFMGVIILGLRPSIFNEFYHSVLADQRGMIGLYQGNGIVVARHPGGQDITGEDISRSPFMINAFQSQSDGLWEGRSVLDGELRTYAYTRSGKYPLLVASGFTQKEWQAEWSQQTNQILSLAAICNMLVLILSLALYLQTARRTRAVAALRNANETLEQRVSARSADLIDREAKLRTIVRVARDALIVANHRGIILEFNPGAQILFGYSPDEVVGRSINMLMPETVAAQHDAYLAHPGEASAHTMGRGREITGLTRDGRDISLEITVGNQMLPDGGIFVAVVRDITDRKRMEHHLTTLANTDSLTGLLNRRAFTQQADYIIRQSTTLAVLMLDADYFKVINDTHGHAAGDLVLQSLAETLRGTIRAGDLIGRLGGEEFGILLTNCGPDGAVLQADRILRAVRDSRVVLGGGIPLSFTISIGIAQLRVGDDISMLLNRADTALYQAKQQGRNRYITAHPAKDVDSSLPVG